MIIKFNFYQFLNFPRGKECRFDLLIKTFLRRNQCFIIKIFLTAFLILADLAIVALYSKKICLGCVIYKDFLNFWPFHIYFLINCLIRKACSHFLIKTCNLMDAPTKDGRRTCTHCGENISKAHFYRAHNGGKCRSEEVSLQFAGKYIFCY